MIKVVNLGIEVANASGKAGNIILKVFDFERQLASDCLDAVNLSEYSLELIERSQTLLDGELLLIFLIGSH